MRTHTFGPHAQCLPIYLTLERGRPADERPDGARRISVNFEGFHSGAEGLLSK